jgi:hypothetical protein
MSSIECLLDCTLDMMVGRLYERVRRSRTGRGRMDGPGAGEEGRLPTPPPGMMDDDECAPERAETRRRPVPARCAGIPDDVMGPRISTDNSQTYQLPVIQSPSTSFTFFLITIPRIHTPRLIPNKLILKYLTKWTDDPLPVRQPLRPEIHTL